MNPTSKPKVFVTGYSSMLGAEVVKLLQDKYYVIDPETSKDFLSCNVNSWSKRTVDLTRYSDVVDIFRKHEIDYVIHLATYSGNIQFNTKYPADTYANTSLMGLNVFRACKEFNIKKILSIISSCAYPNIADGELYEKDFHKGQQHLSIESHGAAKRNLEVLSRLYRQQYGLNAVCAVLTNSFGPRDSFSVEKTKVVCGLIKKFVEAKLQNKEEVVCWGRGVELRELIYSKDAAKLIVKAFEQYEDGSMPINLGTPNEISIKNLTEVVAKAVGGHYNIVWDTSKPDGQLRKKLNLDRMNSLLFNDGDFEYTPFETAVQETVNWYLENKETWLK